MYEVKLRVILVREGLRYVVLKGRDSELSGDSLIRKELGVDIACAEVNR